jgi:NAD(P)H dehydrogenase (quinone)
MSHGATLGAGKQGRIAAATRADYAAAAVTVLTSLDHAGKL